VDAGKVKRLRAVPPKKKTPETSELLFSDHGLSPIQTRLVNSSHDIAMNDPEGITYHHTVFCQTGLPYRNPGENVRLWEHKQGKAILEVSAGRVINPSTFEFVNVGLPFGPKPRLILTHLNSQALKTGSPVIEVESSLTAFVKRLGLDGNGRDVRSIKDHLSRLSAATIRIGFVAENRAVQVNTQIVKAFDLWFQKNDRQRVLWPSTVQLSDDYFQSLVNHAVPLDERAVSALSHSAMALDVYAWLAQRLHRLKQPQFITWVALKEQFGYHYDRMDNFKRVFTHTLTIVHSQYHNARFQIDGKGMTLQHSQPPIKSCFHRLS
jgi:hypothetical protein